MLANQSNYEDFESCLDWRRPAHGNNPELLQTVTQMLGDIETQGDQYIDQLSQKFDGFLPQWIELKPFEDYKLDAKLADSIERAAVRIKNFCLFQKTQFTDSFFEDESGRFGFVYKPIERVGAYIPGGRFPLISTALMTLIPAKVAGCKERIACSPSDHPAVLAAASLAGATAFLKIGGVQAVAALANGYEDLDPVHMVVGPGNQYVNSAKQLLQNKISIDVAAGPSELLILADENINTEWLITDMAAQAEHDPQAISVLVSTNEKLLCKLRRLLKQDVETKQLLIKQQIFLIKADSTAQMIEFSEQFAAEHLLLADRAIKSEDLQHYGSLFIGQNSAIAYGDYCSGPNHTLPTMATANRSSGLSVQSFLKLQSVQEVSDIGRAILSEIGEGLAAEEQLSWHEKSMKIRS